jgi:hypothetical protein
MHQWDHQLISSGGLCTLHDVWERPPAINLPQTPHGAGAYDTGYVLDHQLISYARLPVGTYNAKDKELEGKRQKR